MPAAEAANVPAITALQRSDLESRVRRNVPAITLGGLVLIALGAAMLIINNVATAFAGIFIALFGASLSVPVLTIALMRAATLTLGRVGLIGRMAARTITHALSRTSVAIAALMIAVSVVIGVTVMIASFRATVVNWLDQTLSADVFVSPPENGVNYSNVLDASLAGKIRVILVSRASNSFVTRTRTRPISATFD